MRTKKQYEARIALLTARGPHNNKIIRKLERKIRACEGDKEC